MTLSVIGFRWTFVGDRSVAEITSTMRSHHRILVPAVAVAALLLPSIALANGCACSGVGVLGLLALMVLVVLVAGPLALLGLVILAILVARGILRRNSPWMRVGFWGFRVAFASTTLVTMGLRYAGLLREGHNLVGISGLIVASAALYGVYLYMAVSGLREPTLPGA